MLVCGKEALQIDGVLAGSAFLEADGKQKALVTDLAAIEGGVHTAKVNEIESSSSKNKH